MTCGPHQAGHQSSAATNRINMFRDRTLFYTAFSTEIKFFMLFKILEVLEAEGTFLQWKTISGHRGKWKCEDIYLSLILAPVIAKQFDQLPLEVDEGMRCRHRWITFEGIFDPPASSSQQTRVTPVKSLQFKSICMEILYQMKMLSTWFLPDHMYLFQCPLGRSRTSPSSSKKILGMLALVFSSSSLPWSSTRGSWRLGLMEPRFALYNLKLHPSRWQPLIPV